MVSIEVVMITLTPFNAGGSHQYAIMVTLTLDHLPYYNECISDMTDWCDDTLPHHTTANYFYFEKESNREWFIMRWS